VGIDWALNHGVRSMGRFPFAALRRRKPRLGPPCKIDHLQFPFRQWDGPIGIWAEHFGKGRGQVYSLDRSEPLRSCNEVEVAKILRQVRRHAFWVCSFDTSRMPTIWRSWVLSMNELPPWLARIDTSVRLRISSRKGGMPDVVAWNDGNPVRSALFVECKGANEGFKEAQEDWLYIALGNGLKEEQFDVSVRPF